MDIQVGDRITYKFIDKDGIFTEIVGSNNLSLTSIHWFKEHLEDKEIEIIKIERPKYEVVEEKKELLTEEEKQFLRYMCKYYDIKKIAFRGNEMDIYSKDSENSEDMIACIDCPKSLTFEGIEDGILHISKELGLEEK